MLFDFINFHHQILAHLGQRHANAVGFITSSDIDAAGYHSFCILVGHYTLELSDAIGSGVGNIPSSPKNEGQRRGYLLEKTSILLAQPINSKKRFRYWLDWLRQVQGCF